ncbi:hypothetical protein TB2_010866 [Malus domestica]
MTGVISSEYGTKLAAAREKAEADGGNSKKCFCTRQTTEDERAEGESCQGHHRHDLETEFHDLLLNNDAD